MPIKFIFAMFLCFPVHLFAADNDDDLPELRELCYVKKVSGSCSALQGRLQYLKRYPEALKASELACDGDSNYCSQSIYIAKRIDKETTESIIKKLQGRCKDNVDVCNDLAYALEDSGKKKDAIAAAKLYYEKNKSGIFPWFSYKYGDKKVAFAATYDECKQKASSCVFYLRYMPDHPQYDFIVKQSEFACKNQIDAGEGASICSIVGSYFIKKKNFSSACENLSIDCSHNALSCLLIVGTQDFSEDKRSAAALQFCENRIGEMHTSALQRKYCSQIKWDRKIPEPVAQEADSLVKSFLSEQH